MASAHTGTWGAEFGPTSDLGFIRQTLNTTAGQSYNVTFWLAGTGQLNRFQFYWGGTLFTQMDYTNDFDYAPMEIDGLLALEETTDLMFGFWSPSGGVFYIDDIVVLPQ